MYPCTFKEKFPCGRGFEWTLKGHYFEKKILSSKNISLESIEWLEFMQSDPRLINSKGKVCKIRHGWNCEEVKIDKYYVDGIAQVDLNYYIFEYNGCAFHFCSKCKNQTGIKRDNLEKTKFLDDYAKKYKNFFIIRESSCQWLKKSKEIILKSEISPILKERKIHSDVFLDLIRNNKLYGFAVVDLIATSKASKFLDLNFPPILLKEDIQISDLPDWMKQNVDEKTFPRNTIVQSMNAKKLLLHSSLLKFYLENGFFMTKCYSFFEYQGQNCFKKIFNKIYRARVQATKERNIPGRKEDAERKATVIKLVSNSMYGRFLLSPKKFTKTRLMTKKSFEKHKKSITYKKSSKMSENIFEITRAHTNYVEKYPLHCGLTVLHLSKLILLKFILFLYDHLIESSYELIYTGNNYI